MSLLDNRERSKLKTLLGKCLDNGKLNSDKTDVFIEVCVRKGYDLCDDQNEMDKQEHESRSQARAVRWDDES